MGQHHQLGWLKGPSVRGYQDDVAESCSSAYDIFRLNYLPDKESHPADQAGKKKLGCFDRRCRMYNRNGAAIVSKARLKFGPAGSPQAYEPPNASGVSCPLGSRLL